MRMIGYALGPPPKKEKMATPGRKGKGRRGKALQTRLVASPTDQPQRSEQINKPSSKSEEDLMCSVCLERLKDPRLLPCLHTYCKGCLQGILRKSREKSSMICPQCRSTHAIPSGGVDEFPSDMVSANALDFHSLKDKENITQFIPCSMCTEDDPVTTHCLTCSRFLCGFCSKAHKRQVDYRDHKTVSLDDLDSETLKGFERSRRCSRHSGELLKLYCKTCHKLICRDCTLVDHHNHTFGFLKDIRPDIQKQVENSVEMLSTKQEELKSHLQFTNDIEKSRIDHSEGLEREINSAFDSYIATVESHRKKLLEQERKAKDRDLKQIWAQKEFIEMKLASIDGSTQYANRLCSCPSDLDMLEMSVEATQQLSNLSEVEWNPTSQLQLPVPLVFSAVASLNQDVVGNINPVSLQHFSISMSRADSSSVQSALQHSGVQCGPQSQEQPTYDSEDSEEHFNDPRYDYSPEEQLSDDLGYDYTLGEQPTYGEYDSEEEQLTYGGYEWEDPEEQVELGKEVQLVVHLQSNPPASISSSLIIPSISVTTPDSRPSANYVVTHQEDGSWMITVTPLHSGEYSVTASLQKHSAESEGQGAYSKTICKKRYPFTVTEKRNS